MIKSYSVTLAATVKRLSDVAFTPSGDPAQNIPFRQLLFTASADSYLGQDATVTTSTGLKVATASTMPISIGPFPTGPVKLSDFYAIAGGAATLNILGVPF